MRRWRRSSAPEVARRPAPVPPAGQEVAGGARRARRRPRPARPARAARRVPPRSWMEPDEQADTLAFLEKNGLAYVSVDAPRTRASNVIPSIAAATHPVAYVPSTGETGRRGTSGTREPQANASTGATRRRARGVGGTAVGARRAGRGGIRAFQQQPQRLRAVGRPAAAAAARLGRSAASGGIEPETQRQLQLGDG